jgi:hypothetical protein
VAAQRLLVAEEDARGREGQRKREAVC